MNPSRILSAGLVAGLLAAAAGCIVPTLQPLFTEKEAVFDAAIVGTWVPDEEKPKETWTFSKDGDSNAYKLEVVDAEKRKASIAGILGEVDGKRYFCFRLEGDSLETLPESARWFGLPIYWLIFRVEETAPRLKLVMLDPDACAKFLRENPGAVAHAWSGDGTEEHQKDSLPVLTAKPAELRAFLKQHGESAKLFSEKVTELRRGAPALPPPVVSEPVPPKQP